jgi:diguanylate cyclase (GGDEF)-like protein/PAS domain S-box-containing protein
MTIASNSGKDINDDSTVYKTLLESTRAIPWKIDWKSMKFAYIGPQIENLLGWSPESWVSVEDWAERMHPEDRDWVVDFCVAQSTAGTDHEADYRALTSSGDYVWIRDVVHVVRKDGEVEALIGFMFDISERKRNEEKVLQLQKELEELSFMDGLTGVANRRMLDSALEQEWANAQRTRQPLSLILLDIDYFKAYNDYYGHIGGDDCLRRVAQALTSVAMRPRDFIGRFGGEEFVLLLPDTDAQAAATIAERCRRTILDLRIPHEESAVSEYLSISLGVDTVIPQPGANANDFVSAVDTRLYKAKQSGRNRVESGLRPQAGEQAN